jgi:Protein of unknown function (DUF2934)
MARTPGRSTTRNPLAIDPQREQRIRERAYHLWETDGKPHGHDVEYWERARELIGMEESAGSGLLPNPQTAANSPRQTGSEKAEIRANPSELPDRAADQGERKAAPAVKRAPRSPARAKPKKPT